MVAAPLGSLGLPTLFLLFCFSMVLVSACCRNHRIVYRCAVVTAGTFCKHNSILGNKGIAESASFTYDVKLHNFSPATALKTGTVIARIDIQSRKVMLTFLVEADKIQIYAHCDTSFSGIILIRIAGVRNFIITIITETKRGNKVCGDLVRAERTETGLGSFGKPHFKFLSTCGTKNTVHMIFLLEIVQDV